MNKIYYGLFGIFLFFGCRVLSKQESKGVQALAKALNTSGDLPANFAKQYYDLSFETLQASASHEKDPATKISVLNDQINLHKEADSIVKGYSSGFGILKKYADLLLALSDTGYLKEFTKQKDAFVPAFDSLIAKYNSYYPKQKLPVASLGGFAGKLIDELGSRRIRYLQHKYLKQLLNDADTIISHICKEYQILDFYKNNKQIESLNTDIELKYVDFMKFINLGSQSDPYSYYKFFDPIYLDWKNKVSTLGEFNTQTNATLAKLRVAHKQLINELDKKVSFKDFTKKLWDLYGSINSLEESYNKFKKDLTPSKTNK
jgi:hypothetical protein